jgi:excisionase family DNA binding protein
MEQKQLLTRKEVAELLRVNVRTVEKLPELKPIKVGNQFRYRATEVAAFVAGL